MCIDSGPCWLRLHGMPDGIDLVILFNFFVIVVFVGQNHADFSENPDTSRCFKFAKVYSGYITRPRDTYEEVGDPSRLPAKVAGRC